MGLQRVTDSLTALFASHPVVFWHDVDSEFSATVDGLEVEGMQVVRLDQTAALSVKLDIERSPGNR